jgi:hypothetical protein
VLCKGGFVERENKLDVVMINTYLVGGVGLVSFGFVFTNWSFFYFQILKLFPIFTFLAVFIEAGVIDTTELHFDR